MSNTSTAPNCHHGWVEPNASGKLECCDCGREIYGDSTLVAEAHEAAGLP